MLRKKKGIDRLKLSVAKCVCVCVCVREREREREIRYMLSLESRCLPGIFCGDDGVYFNVNLQLRSNLTHT